VRGYRPGHAGGASMPVLESLSWIVVEGPIGVGKTTLARRLAEHLEAQLLLEEPERNPFLAGYYRDPRRYALPTQLAFLLDRSRQLDAVAQPDLYVPQVVSDFIPEKDLLFAELSLDEEALRLYRTLHERLLQTGGRRTPALVIYLQAPVEQLQSRVRRRGRAYEQGLEPGYLELVAEAYARLFMDYQAAPVMTINTAHLDPAHQAADFDLLTRELEQVSGPRSYLNPGLFGPRLHG